MLLKSELIALLAALPGDFPIMIQGYEGGLCDISEDKVVFEPFVCLNRNEEGFEGPHEAYKAEDIRGEFLFEEEKKFTFVRAYVIRRI